MTDDETEVLTRLVKEFHNAIAGNKLNAFYHPYRWQQRFHEAGDNYRERMLMAANRVGKTQTAGAEVAIHLTGDYDGLAKEIRYPDALPNGQKHPNAGELVWPNGWTGRRFPYPTLAWTGSPTSETSRDIVQRELIGGLGEDLGTGWIPRDKLIGQPKIRQAGVRDVAEMFKVRHVTGGVSTCNLKTYDQGWKKWQGTAPHVVWLDEEPDDYMIYSEAQTRILSANGILMVTFTPLSGATELVEHFQELSDKAGTGVYLQGATWDDAPHLSNEDKAQLKQSYRAHEVEARTAGVPMLGEGAVFPIGDDSIRVDPFNIPGHFVRLKGCDFGISHPAAGVEIAWDRDFDVIYVVDCYKEADKTAAYHATWFNKANRRIPVAWPHDGMNREKSGGKTLAASYREHGVNMLSKSARYRRVTGETAEKGGPQPVEPVIDEIYGRMLTNQFKVFANCHQWFEEKRSYHRKDGKIVDKRDDILKATFYAVMMKRYAIAPDSFEHRFGHRGAPAHSIATTRL